jgi:predicted nuclease with TOPRIM domain
MLKDFELHERYIVDETGNRTEVVLEIETFAKMLETLRELQRRLDELEESVEMAEDVRAFDLAMADLGDVLPLDEALAEVERDRAKA